MPYGISDKSYNLILKAFKDNNIKKVILFGSRVMGNYKKGSDIDLVVDSSSHRLATILNQELPVPYTFNVLGSSIKNNNLQ